jgi:hypothetical protein
MHQRVSVGFASLAPSADGRGQPNDTAAIYASEAETSKVLREVEESYDLLRHTHSGWSVWPLLRFRVSRDLQNLPLDPRRPKGISRSKLHRIALSDLARIARKRPVRFMAKSYSSSHSDLDEERLKCIFFDDLLTHLGDFYKLEYLNRPDIRNGPSSYLIPPDGTTVFWHGLAGRLANRFVSQTARRIATEVSTDLEQAFPGRGYSAHWVQRAINSFHWNKRLLGALLRRIKPDALFLLNPGDHPITAAAKEAGIRVVEFQHGMFTRDYPAISWSPYACQYRDRMPLPDRLFLYGDHWVNELKATGFWSEELRSVGSMRIDQHRERPRADSDPEFCSMVLTSQGVDTPRLLEFLREFLDISADRRLAIRLAIKVHPANYDSVDPYLNALGGDDRVRVISASDAPSTFELLRSADVHLSIYSTCHYEALAFGVPTVVLPLIGHENVADLVDAGRAFKPRGPGDLVEYLMNWREKRVDTAASLHYFRHGALQNMTREIEDLLKSPPVAWSS